MPMDRSLYPDNWEAIALQIKQAAHWQCQECGRRCKRPDEDWAEFISSGSIYANPEARLGQYVLTVAHLNHQPADCSPDNLKALCTVCHLRYDSQHMATKRRLKRERLGQMVLPLSVGGESDG